MLSYRIDGARRLVTVTGTGVLTAHEISEAQAAIGTDPEFHPGFALLIDFRTASLSTVEAEEVRRHALEDPFAPNSPRAIVISSEVDYGVVRMFEAYSELAGRSGPVQAFRDPAGALSWLEEVCAAQP